MDYQLFLGDVFHGDIEELHDAMLNSTDIIGQIDSEWSQFKKNDLYSAIIRLISKVYEEGKREWRD